MLGSITHGATIEVIAVASHDTGSEISGIVEGRELIARSVETKMYEPQDKTQWETAFDLFKAKALRISKVG